jgi:signal transduction histidine kinase/multisubunit Na+/H+ antiporter MnhG subunit
MATLATTFFAQLLTILPQEVPLLGYRQPALYVVLGSAVLVAMTGLTIKFLSLRGVRGMVAAFGWLLVLAVLLWGEATQTGQLGWFGRVLAGADWRGALALGGWVALGTLSLVSTFRQYYRAELPEQANRALFWALILPLALLGVVMGSSGSTFLRESGWLVLFAATAGLLYACIEHRVLDMRRLLRLGLASVAVTFVTALVIFATLIIVSQTTPEPGLQVVVYAVIATIAAIIYTPLQAVTLGVVRRVSGGNPVEDTTSAVRFYSQRVTSVVELHDLAEAVTDSIREAMRVRGGGLLLVTQEPDGAVLIEPLMVTTAPRPPMQLRLPPTNPIYRRMFVNHLPLMQYDLEFAKDYEEIGTEVRQFFKQLRMNAYAPIVVQGGLVGVLAAGAKLNDDPVYPEDLQLLEALANQTGVALRNARLVTDMRRASIETKSLNSDLMRTKVRLEQLDSVKSDFVTIASHELRTPLAQIRGYTDILDAMNEQAMLDQEQVAGMVNNMRKATDRLEKLIADMLDVSQLGLDAMDLRFAQTTLDAVLRLAIEPLSESIKQRKLQLAARGLKGLPPIEADMQRLVQAFRNVVVNAVKYTPDGGRIDIIARKEFNHQTGEDEIVVNITDTGIGIDPRNFELIFEKFFRVADPGLHSTGATKFMGAGPGLGLTIARGVIEGHGGRIKVESGGYDTQNLPGSTFTIYLPVQPPKEARRVLAIDPTTGLGQVTPLALQSTAAATAGNATGATAQTAWRK